MIKISYEFKDKVFLCRYDLHPFKVKNAMDCQASWFKQDISKELNEIHLEMQKLLTYKQTPSPRLGDSIG